MNNRLHITSVENNQKPSSPAVSRGTRRHEIEARMERLWLEDPEQFNPERDAVQRKRILNTIEVIKNHQDLKDKHCTDLGCGAGTITRHLRDAGARVDAVDIATNALNLLKSRGMENIKAVHDCLPSTHLDDDAYDVVVCTEMIGYLQPNEYRMLFAELSRLVKKDGWAVCSSSLDINSENALERFAALAETEFDIDEWVLHYDLLWIKLCNFVEATENWIKASQNPWQRSKEIEKRKSIGKFWFQLNSTKPMALFWRPLNLGTRPLAKMFRQSDRLVNFLEKITKFFWDEAGISHALFVGKRRPMSFPLPQNEIPIEMKHKRQQWD